MPALEKEEEAPFWDWHPTPVSRKQWGLLGQQLPPYPSLEVGKAGGGTFLSPNFCERQSLMHEESEGSIVTYLHYVEEGPHQNC